MLRKESLQLVPEFLSEVGGPIGMMQNVKLHGPEQKVFQLPVIHWIALVGSFRDFATCWRNELISILVIAPR